MKYTPILLAMVLAGCAVSREEIVGPAWTGPRSNAGSQVNYPLTALKANVSGVVMVVCTITPSREARECRAERESPTGWGFGDAAVGMHENVDVPPETPVGSAFFTVPFCTSVESCQSQRAVSAGWRRETQALRPVAH
jgi:hypothetical protein